MKPTSSGWRSTLTTGMALAFLMCGARAEVTSPRPERLRYDAKAFQIEGKDVFLYGGAFHYFRTPPGQWRDRFQKIKDAGFNMVETYVPWNYHEPQAPKGPGDDSKINLGELDAWLKMAEEFGFYVVVRPGPYICAEWSGGGFPQWLVPVFKPKNWSADKVWLQTDDKDYLAWNKHWYDAVAKVVAPHQITRKAPGSPGVIVFQIENEYERINWIPQQQKTNHLAAIARQARDAGIDVLLASCWTKETRNSTNPDLKDVVDFVNSYPRWNVKGQITKQVAEQLKDAPEKPLAAMELQGGWYAEIGGRLSEQIDGVQAVQTQNLTLFCLQSGYSAINYYMLNGGTNFDDWASRDTCTTYDYFAAIREHGGVGEKWRRLAGIGALLREHGTKIIRSTKIDIEAKTDSDKVEITLLRAQDGTNYFFVRTEDRGAEHKGTARVKAGSSEYTFDYALEKFGSQVLVLAPGVTDASKGEWLPKLAPGPARPAMADLPRRIDLAKALRVAEPKPLKWTPLPAGASLESLGLTDSHPIFYRVRPSAGGELVVGRLGAKVITSTQANGVGVQAGDKILSEKSANAGTVTFDLPANTNEAVLLFENIGQHHHTTAKLEHEWPIGLRGVKLGDRELPLEFATTERDRGMKISRPETPVGAGFKEVGIGPDAAPAPDALMSWYRFEFELPPAAKGVWVPWQFLLDATGNGFLYLNGHCIGRTWEIGPQREFYLPEAWLNSGPGKKNIVAVSLVPRGKGIHVTKAAVIPANDFAETRK